MKSVIWTKPAQGDLQSIGEYIAEDNLKVSLDVVDRLLSSGNGLAMFSKRDRIEDIDGTLELVVDKTRFNIVYAVFKDEVQILAIVHQSEQRPISKDVEKTILELLQ